MRNILGLALSSALVIWAQPQGLRVDGVTATQAILSYQAPDEGACQVDVSESPSFNSSVDDTNSILFPNSNLDTGRAFVSGGRRVFVVGTRNSARATDGRMHSRALAASTRHYARVTCGSPVATEFVTGEVQGLVPEAPPFSSDGLGNFGFPEYDFSNRAKGVVDPQTGARMYQVASPKDFAHVGDYNFVNGAYFGGTGWSNAQNITSASMGSTASTTTTNPIFLPMKLLDAYIYGNWHAYQLDGALVDAALHLYGRGTDSNAENRKIKICLSVDSGQTCYTNNVDVTLTTNNRDAGFYPSTFPTAGAANAAWAPFVGWGRVVPRNFMATGTANIGAGTLSVNPTGQGAAWSYLNPEWAAGSKVFVAGSSPTCANNFCTIRSVDSNTQLTLEENVTASNVQWYFAGLGFRIQKATATGTVALSASYKLAKTYAIEAGPDMGCSRTTVTTHVDRQGNPITPGIVGRLCVFNIFRAGRGAIYFVGEDTPEFRLISLGRVPSNPPAGHDVNQDWVYPAAGILPGNPSIFDSQNPNTFYVGVTTNSGGPAVFKGVYTGDYREASGLFFTVGNDTGLPTYVNDGITWTNLTRASAGQGLRAKILAGSSYNESVYGSLSSGLGFVGIAENHAIFLKMIASQDDACWIFSFNASTGALAGAWNTITGGGSAGQRYGGCHAVLTTAGRVLIANNGLRRQNTGTLYGGPFISQISHLYRNGEASTNTALPGAPDGSYDSACPADLEQRWKDLGAVGNNCVRVRFSGEPCSSFATVAEKALTPCPGDPSKSFIGVPAAPGDELHDAAHHPDNEHLLLVKRTNLAGTTFEAILMRNAGNSYCCYGKEPGRCAGVVAQATHLAGWSAVFVPQGSCVSVTQLVAPADPGQATFEAGVYMRGHFSYETSSTGEIHFVGIGANGKYEARYNSTISGIGRFNTFPLEYAPVFAGVRLDTAVTQSYISPGLSGIGTDWRHFNGGLGLDVEYPGQLVGPNLSITKVNGEQSTFKVTGFTVPVVRVQPLIVWAGIHTFRDVSSAQTGDLVSDRTPWTYCFVLRAGECRTGSTANELYIVAPGLDSSVLNCHASQVSRNVLCVFPLGPAQAQILQLRTSAADVSGLSQRRLGPNNTAPGAQYVYSHSRPFSSSQPMKVFATQFHQSGVWTGPALVDGGPWSEQSARTGFSPIPVQLAAKAGSDRARIRFGYVDAGVPTKNWWCTSRAEDCVTDTSGQVPAFLGDNPAAMVCTSGCTITIPALPGRVMVYQVERLSGQAVVEIEPLQWTAVH